MEKQEFIDLKIGDVIYNKKDPRNKLVIRETIKLKKYWDEEQQKELGFIKAEIIPIYSYKHYNIRTLLLKEKADQEKLKYKDWSEELSKEYLQLVFNMILSLEEFVKERLEE